MTSLRDLEKASIRAFVQQAADDGYLSGRVLDYGCGKQPYRGIVETAGGTYTGYDEKSFPGNVSGEDLHWPPGALEEYDTILCTQVLQYVPDEFDPHLYECHSGVWALLDEFNRFLNPSRTQRPEHGHLVLTYPTNWPEVEPEDLHRFTKAGMERLLTEAGFEIIRHERRGRLFDPAFLTGRNKRIVATGEEFALGYGCVARA